MVAGPAVGAAVVRYARNAGKVDGKHAVGAGARRSARAGKLVATDKRTGRLPNNIIAKAPNASKLGGRKASKYVTKSLLSESGTLNQSLNPVDWSKLKGVPGAFADESDDIGPSAWAHVRADGTQVAWRNIDATGVSVPNANQGIYCFDLAQTAALIQATPSVAAGSRVVTEGARIIANLDAGALGCTAPHDDAVVSFRTATGATPPGGFFVSFMFAQP
jgi:hypothetical protein